MTLIKTSIYSLSIVLLFSCTTNRKTQFSEKQLEDLVETFDLDENAFEKFKVKEKPDIVVKETVEKSQAPVKKDQKVSKPKTKKKSAKQVVKKKKIITKEKEPVEVTKVEDKAPKVEPPKTNYPEKYKKYDDVSKNIWSKFEPVVYIGEKHLIKIKYLGITVGHIKISSKPIVSINDREAFHYRGVLKSEKYYEMLYKLDDSIDTFVDKESFRPIKFSLIQRESGKTVDDLQLFDHKEFKTFHWYKKVKKGKVTKREKGGSIPQYFQDTFSAIFFMRGLPLKNGQAYEFPVVTRAKLYISKVKVEKREKLRVGKKWYNAVKLNASNHFPGIVKEKSNIDFWFSDDKYRKLLKFNSQIKIGSVQGDLVEYESGTRYKNQ